MQLKSDPRWQIESNQFDSVLKTMYLIAYPCIASCNFWFVIGFHLINIITLIDKFEFKDSNLPQHIKAFLKLPHKHQISISTS